MTRQKSVPFDVAGEVRRRYAAAAETVELSLCCPTDCYDPQYLAVIPAEIVDNDYGCGDPSKRVNAGQTVLDLGSGAGKICYILAQKVGPTGKVIGVDCNDAMLALARRHQQSIADKLGYHNTDFRKGHIEDLALDLEAAQAWLDEHPIRTIDQHAAFEAECRRLRRDGPLVADASVDVVVSNCVLNLVEPGAKAQLFAEMHRVLARGGRAVISDIVCDESPTQRIVNDPKLWSGCIAGAFREDRFLQMFEDAGFCGVEILGRAEQPWQTIDGIEFRSMTVCAYKGKAGPCLERHQAVVYKGPWKQVRDDDGHTFHRGRRMAVCDKTYRIMTDPQGPYAGQVIGIDPRWEVPPAEAAPFDCAKATIRDPRQTKGADYDVTQVNEDAPCCAPDSGCC